MAAILAMFPCTDKALVLLIKIIVPAKHTIRKISENTRPGMIFPFETKMKPTPPEAIMSNVKMNEASPVPLRFA